METEKLQQDAIQDEQISSSSQPQEKALSECQTQLAEWKDKFIRLLSDFQNFKKRLSKEQASQARMMQADVLLDMLVILDNFDRALQERPEQNAEIKSWADGFELIRKYLYKVFEKYGVKEMESFDEFKPEFHEAVMHVESSKHEPGSIVEVLQKGYLIGDMVLRPAKVSIAQ